MILWLMICLGSLATNAVTLKERLYCDVVLIYQYSEPTEDDLPSRSSRREIRTSLEVGDGEAPLDQSQSFPNGVSLIVKPEFGSGSEAPMCRISLEVLKPNGNPLQFRARAGVVSGEPLEFDVKSGPGETLRLEITPYYLAPGHRVQGRHPDGRPCIVEPKRLREQD